MHLRRRIVVAMAVAALGVARANAQTPTPIHQERAYSRTAPRSTVRTPLALAKRRSTFRSTSVPQAWQSAISKKQPLIVMFTSDSCRYCAKMLKETYGHPAISHMLSTQTETVLAHAESNKALIKRLGIRAFPTSLIVSPEGKIVRSIEGYVAPQAFYSQVEPLLRQMQAKPPAIGATVSQASTSSGRG